MTTPSKKGGKPAPHRTPAARRSHKRASSPRSRDMKKCLSKWRLVTVDPSTGLQTQPVGHVAQPRVDPSISLQTQSVGHAAQPRVDPSVSLQTQSMGHAAQPISKAADSCRDDTLVNQDLFKPLKPPLHTYIITSPEVHLHGPNTPQPEDSPTHDQQAFEMEIFQQYLGMSSALLKYCKPSDQLLLGAEIIIKLALLDPTSTAGLSALMKSIIELLKWIGPKSHPPLSIDLIALHDPPNCLPVLIEHIIVLLQLIEPKPNPSLLTRVIERTRFRCSISLKVPEQSHVGHVDGISPGGDISIPASPAQSTQLTGRHDSTLDRDDTQGETNEHQDILPMCRSSSVENGLSNSVASSESSEHISTFTTSSQQAAEPSSTMPASHQHRPPAADSNNNMDKIDRQGRQAKDLSENIAAQHQETQTSKKPKEDKTDLITHQLNPGHRGSNSGSPDTTQKSSFPSTLHPDLIDLLLRLAPTKQ